MRHRFLPGVSASGHIFQNGKKFRYLWTAATGLALKPYHKPNGNAMTVEEIRNGNQLIVDLMDSTIKIAQEDVKDIPIAFLAIDDMKFHVSWKWLMPVVIKVEEELGHDVLIRGKSCRIETGDGSVFEHEGETKMEAVWQAVVNLLQA